MMIHPGEAVDTSLSAQGTREKQARRAANSFVNEYVRARNIHQPFHSAHEALAVVWEEFEELKAAIFSLHPGDPLDAVKKEAIQLGAMAIALLAEVAPIMPGVNNQEGPDAVVYLASGGVVEAKTHVCP